MTIVYGGTTNGCWSSVLDYSDQSDNATYKLTCKLYSRVTNSNYVVQLGDGVEAFGTLKNTLSATGQSSSTKTIGSAYSAIGDGSDLVSKTFSWPKTHSSQSITITGTSVLSNGEFWSGSSHSRISGTSTATKTITIPAKPSYTVSYNANGGSGAPANQTKWYGENLTLSSTTPTRSGWTFMGWGTSASATSVSYAKGATYSSNAAITLYAIWRKTVTVTYNANGGTGAPASQSVNIYNSATSGNITLTTTKPTRTGFVFLGWNTSSTATSANRTGGTAYAFSANTTLYAVWDAVPSISSLTAVRCDADGTQNDEGECASITATWSLDGTLGDRATITGTITPQTGGSAAAFTLTTPSQYGSGVVSTAIIGNVNGTVNGMVVDTDMQYTVTVVVANGSRTTSRSTIITRSFFIMDFKAGGNGLGIGRAAPANGLEIGFPTVFDEDVTSFGNFNMPVNGSNITHFRLPDSRMNRGYNAVPTTGAQVERCIGTLDKDGNWIGRLTFRQNAAGVKYSILEAAGVNSSGTTVWTSLASMVNADGTRAYAVTDQAAFRNALGASSGIFPASVGGTGSAYYDTNPPADVNGSQVSVANNTNTTIATMTITSPGKYLIHAGFAFASNATGRRFCGLAFDDTTSLGSRTQTWSCPPANGGNTYMPFLRVVNATGSSYKIRANVYQNSGAALNCSCYLFAFRLK